MEDLISIAIPTYNRIKLLLPLVHSIRAKSELIPLIIVDDCSKDKTALEIRKLQKIYKNIELIQNFSNKGRSIARNLALENCKTEYIFYLDSDDILYEQWPSIFSEAVILFKELPNNISSVTFNLNFSGHHYFNKYIEYNYSDFALKKGKFLCSCSSALHKVSILKKFLFDPKLDICEDIKLWIEISKNYNFFHLPKTISLYEPSKKSISFRDKINALLTIEPESKIQKQLLYNLMFSTMIKDNLRLTIKRSPLLSFIWYVLKFFK